MFTKLPKIQNNYTPWPRVNLGIYLKDYRAQPSHGLTWKTSNHGYYLPIKTVFGMFYIGWFQMAQIQTSAQGYTLHLQVGHWLFAFISAGQRTCESCKHFHAESTCDHDSGYDYEEFCKKDFPNHWSLHPQSELGMNDATYESWRCPAYEKFDWVAHDKALTEADAALQKQLAEDEKFWADYLASPEYQDMLERSEKERFKELGWLDSEGNITDDYFRAAQQAFETFANK